MNLKKITAPAPYEFEVAGKSYEVIDTFNEPGELIVIVAEKGDDDSDIRVKISWDEIHSELLNNGECDLFQDATGRDGEHTTVDTFVSPEEVWSDMSHNEQMVFVEDNLIKAVQHGHIQ